MDTFESASPPQEQPEMVRATCWECGEIKICHEYVVCCTGTHFYTCPECRDLLQPATSVG
jgi:hypothetical protein